MQNVMLPPSIRIFAVVIAATSFVVTPVSRDQEPATTGRGREALAVRFDQSWEFHECNGILSTTSNSSKSLTRDSFASLLQDIGRGEFDFRLENLPLECSCFFNMHACRNGRQCLGNQANIPISSSEERYFICYTLASMLRQSESTLVP